VAVAGAARAKHFGDVRPGSATITVKALVVPEWLIEIEAVARLTQIQAVNCSGWSRAPFGLRNRSRSSFRMRLRCANSISTFFGSRLEVR
jgi:hypothetical protein